MTTDEKLDRLTGVVEQLAFTVNRHDAMLDRLGATIERNSSVVETLAGAATAHDSVLEAHDRQIGALIELADRNQKSMADLDRRWQAYLNTLRRQ